MDIKKLEKWDKLAYKIIKLEQIRSRAKHRKIIEKVDKEIDELECKKTELIKIALSLIPIKESTINAMFDKEESYDEY